MDVRQPNQRTSMKTLVYKSFNFVNPQYVQRNVQVVRYMYAYIWHVYTLRRILLCASSLVDEKPAQPTTPEDYNDLEMDGEDMDEEEMDV